MDGATVGVPSLRNSVIRMDPDCAICHAPASHACDCEAKALEIAIKQAESRMMPSVRNDLRTWVRNHAQNIVEGDFLDYTRQIESRQRQRSAGEAAPGQEPSIREQVNAGWSTAVQSYPKALEYYYSLVQVGFPDDNDPAVRDPKPLNEPRGAGKAVRRRSPGASSYEAGPSTR
ncbi:Arp2/3 complex subunit, actin nucleation center [Hypoxylon texense]